jgi:hypothetical protein
LGFTRDVEQLGRLRCARWHLNSSIGVNIVEAITKRSVVFFGYMSVEEADHARVLEEGATV